MNPYEIQARHVFHAPTAGWDRVHAWREATAEPVFVWGRHSGGSDGSFFGSVKRDFRLWLQATDSAKLTVYHDGVGADALGPIDPAPHKILHVHNWFPRWERHFDWALRCTGKVLVGHASQANVLHSQYSWIPKRFVQVITEPGLESSFGRKSGPGAGKARTGIWLHGRNWRRFGNRLRSLADRWPDDAGQLEFVVGGKGQPGWARQDRLVWSAGMPLEFALLRLHTWDSTLLLDDFSLDAPWLRQALAIGCFPLVPENDSPSRTPAWQSASAPRPYSWGDLPEAAGLLAQWRREKQDLLPDFSEWCQALLKEERPAAGHADRWNMVKQAFHQQHVPQLRARKPVQGWYRVAWYERLFRMRAGF